MEQQGKRDVETTESKKDLHENHEANVPISLPQSLNHGNLSQDPRELGYEKLSDEEPLLSSSDNDSLDFVPMDVAGGNVPQIPEDLNEEKAVSHDAKNISAAVDPYGGHENLSYNSKGLGDENVSHQQKKLSDEKLPHNQKNPFDGKLSEKPKLLGGEKMLQKSKRLGEETMSQNSNYHSDENLPHSPKNASDVPTNSGGISEPSDEQNSIPNLEEKIKLLRENFPYIPKVMIKQVLQRGDVDGDLDAASRCMKRMSFSGPQCSSQEKLVTTNKAKKQKPPPLLPKPKRNVDDTVKRMHSSVSTEPLKNVKKSEGSETAKRKQKNKSEDEKLEAVQSSSVMSSSSDEGKDSGITCRSNSEKETSKAYKFKPVMHVPNFEPSPIPKNKSDQKKLDALQSNSVIPSSPDEGKDNGETTCRSKSGKETSKPNYKLKPVRNIPKFETKQILVRGLDKSTSRETIMNFAESKTKGHVQEIVRLDDETSALIRFHKKIDFQNAKEKMETRPLEGENITVHRVPVSSSIQVRNLASNTTRDALKIFFSNPRIGGEVTSIQYEEGDEQAVVTFKDPDVLHKILSSTSLELNGAKLKVKSFNQALQVTTREQHTQHDIAVGVDKDVMDFISATDSLNELKKSLKVHGFTMTYTPGDTIIYLAQKPDQDTAVNRERGIKTVMDFINKFKAIELDVDKNHWDAVIIEISKLHTEKIGKDKLLVKECTSSKDKVTIICREPDSKELKKTFMDKIAETQSLEAKKATFKTDTTDIEQEKLRLLKMIGYKDKLVSKYSDLEFEIDEASGKVTIAGPREECYNAIEQIFQEISKFHEKQISSSKVIIDKLDGKEVIERIDRELENLRRMKQIYAVSHINEGNVFITGINQKQAEQASQLVESLFTDDKKPDDHSQEQHTQHDIAVAVDKNVMDFISATDSLNELKKSLKVHGFTMTYTSGGSIIYVALKPDQDTTVNRERGIKTVTDFINKFKAIELDVDKNHWDAVIVEISKLHNKIGKDKLLVKECTSSKDKVTIICREPDSKELKKTFMDKIAETQSLEAKKATYETNTIDIEQDKLRLIRQYKGILLHEFSDLEFNFDETKSQVIITGPNASRAHQRIKQIIDDDSFGHETYYSLDKGVRRYLWEHQKEKLSKVKDYKFQICGTKVGRVQVKEDLQRLADSVSRNKKKIPQPSLHRLVTLDTIIKDIEHKHKCTIEKVESVPQSQGSKGLQDDSNSLNTDLSNNSSGTSSQGAHSSASTSTGSRSEKCGNVTISWKQGDIVKEKVDIQVGTTIGKLYNIFINAGGLELINEVATCDMSSNQVILKKTAKLPCNQVILVKCCIWDGGKGESEKKLRTIVSECLQQASKLNASSIAFPIIGTGGLSFPTNKACQIMISAVIDATRRWRFFLNPTDVRFVVFDQDAKLVNAFQQEFTRAFDQSRGNDRRVGIFASKIYKSVRFPGRTPVTGKDAAGKVPQVQVLQGDLIEETTDAIVNINATDMNMQNAGTLSKAVAAAAGPAVQTECTKLGRQNAGSAVITGAGKLKAKHIIHIVPGEASVKHIQKCLEECLQTAENSRFGSISIPACGTGGLKMSAVDSSQATFQAIANVCPNFKHLKQIRIVIFVPSLVPEFEKKLSELEYAFPEIPYSQRRDLI